MTKIEIYGTGCAKCKQLAKSAEMAAQTLGIAYQLVKVTEMNAIIDAGVISTPGLAINGVLKSSGQLLSSDAIQQLLQDA